MTLELKLVLRVLQLNPPSNTPVPIAHLDAGNLKLALASTPLFISV